MLLLLCEWLEDLLLLVDYFINQILFNFDVLLFVFDNCILVWMVVYEWLGNVCELKNFIECLLIFGWFDFGFELKVSVVLVGVIDELLEVVEKCYILVVFVVCDGNKLEVGCCFGVLCKMLDCKCQVWGMVEVY